jgi:hypothetical protein
MEQTVKCSCHTSYIVSAGLYLAYVAVVAKYLVRGPNFGSDYIVLFPLLLVLVSVLFAVVAAAKF